MDMNEAEVLRFFEKTLGPLEQRGHGLFIGECPQCKKRELRIFPGAVEPEVRCARCAFWTMSLEQLTKKMEALKPKGEERAQVLHPEKGQGVCQVCGAPLPQAKRDPRGRKKRICGDKCRATLRRLRKAGKAIPGMSFLS